MKTVKKQYLCKTELKDIYNFTDKNIEDLLPNPIITKNPYYKKMNMYLWKKDDIDMIVEKDEIKEIIRSNIKRKEKFRASIEKTNDKKRELTKKQYANAANNIKVIVISLKDLKIQAINHKRNLHNRKNDYYFNLALAKEQDIKRWEVNYIRHRLTRYDDLLEIGYGKIGKAEAQKIIIEAVYKKIAILYPSLKEECERQLIDHLNRWDFQIRG